ncbi:MAG TPA: ATP-binding protein, partial [Symbiobacteriaceae bacterium]|nr:ATP-binding protein [Symbiobacteriaceae bacterium]
SVARLQEFALDFKVEPVDLAEAVRRVINQRRKQFIRLTLYPEIDAPDGDWHVLTDAKWNGFVIDQIVSNALKYGSQGGAPGQRLRFSLRRTEAGVTLTIADQGPGIPPEDLPRIFDPFFTGVNGRRFADATGIGLFVVREVTSRLGHRVAVASAPGQGTAVTLTYEPYKSVRLEGPAR